MFHVAGGGLAGVPDAPLSKVLSGSIVETIYLVGNCPLAGRLSIIGDSKAAGNSMAGRAEARPYIGSYKGPRDPGTCESRSIWVILSRRR